MATTYGPEPVTGAASLHAMDQPPSESLRAGGLPGHPQAAPPPNPVFSFPARMDVDASEPEPSTFRPPKRRPMSAIEGTAQSYRLAAERVETRAALPQFSFNPGATLAPEPLDETLSPPASPQSPRTMPSSARPMGHGHRRGGSEFVGGRLREGNSIAVMSGSPTKAESGLDSPGLHPPRRGHRRGVSSALSISDLPLPPPRHDFTFGGSAPTSPTTVDPYPRAQSLDLPQTRASEPSVEQPPEVADEPTSTPPKPPTRTRVGFSDTLEYIPRPLSLVSTDTSSTITAKTGHVVSGSVSSFAAGVSGRESPAMARSPNREGSRPSTAGAVLERTPTLQADEQDVSPRRRNSIPALLDLAEASAVADTEPSPTKSKRWSFFGLEPFIAHGAPPKARPQSSSSVDSANRVVSAASSSEQSETTPVDNCKPSGKKKTKRRKKVKGWADSILPRMPKRSKYAVRPPTPPVADMPPEDEDEDVTEAPEPLAQTMPTVTVTESPNTPRPAQSAGEEVSSPMIDLDAALGPFNTPLPHNPEWDAAQREAGLTGRRRLHSAQGMRGFTGPGMHYHRRAESAPDLPPFDMGRVGINRFGSSSTMADVFEEDEEDDGDDKGSQKLDAAEQPSDPDSDGEATPPAVMPTEPTPIPRRRSSGLSDKDQSSVQSVRMQRSRASLQERAIAEEPTARSDVSVSPGQSPGKVAGGRELPMFELGPPPVMHSAGTPISPYSTSFASSPRSPMSADTQRLSTAPSSLNEEHSFQSLLMGEPGPEVRLSVDYDIPSLTSSTSATTRDSTFAPQARMSQPRLREPRPLSVSSTAFGRRRSSLASLSRLISSSHGERSKLSMEVTLDNEAAEKQKPRSSRTKRLGRLVQFLKGTGAKDNGPSS